MAGEIPPGWVVVTFISQDAPAATRAIARVLHPGSGKEKGKVVYGVPLAHAETEEAAREKLTASLATDYAKALAKKPPGRPKKAAPAPAVEEAI
tara:strand:- start:1111 stop:1392 length:282 start_codon:yes stop_codon:yes gene_type:complete